jgi:hypothetical protein
MSPRNSAGEARMHLPSGEWAGFYVQFRRQYPQRQRMEFSDGIVRGEGSDAIGAFVLEGQYHEGPDGSHHVGWIKTYQQGHSVLYLGSIEGNRIVGDWELQGGSGDRFEFAPESMTQEPRT